MKQLYKQKIRTKSFILTTLLYLVVLSAIMFWSEIKEFFFSGEEDTIAIVNETNFDVAQILQANESYEWEFVSTDGIADKLEEGDYYAAFTLTDEAGKLATKIESYDPLPLNDQQDFTSILSQVGQMYAMGQLDLTQEQQQLYFRRNQLLLLKQLTRKQQMGSPLMKRWREYLFLMPLGSSFTCLLQHTYR